MGRHSQTRETAKSPMAPTNVDRRFIRGGLRAIARKERLVAETEAVDPFDGHPDIKVNRAPKTGRRRRVLAALAITAAAGGLFGAVASKSGNAAPKAPASASAKMFDPMEHAAEKLGAYEKKLQATAELQQAVDGMANNAATRIIRMTAADPHVRQDPGSPRTGVDMYAWCGNYQHPESEVSAWHDQLQISSINMPDGPSGKTWNSIEVNYRIPSSMKGEFSHPMTAENWEALDLSRFQLESIKLLNNSGAESTDLTTADGGYHLGGAPVTQVDQLRDYGSGVDATLGRLSDAQYLYS
jgi:hypothetical protein